MPENIQDPINDLSFLTQSIVTNRESKRADFMQIQESVESIKQTIDIITELRDSDLWLSVINEANLSQDWNTLVSKFEPFKLRFERFTAIDGLYTIASERLKRDYVNVGAVGITREGKSQFTTKITGLDQWVIPTRSGEPCTTAPINVINGVSKADHKSEIARVYYYTVEEMCKLLFMHLNEIAGSAPFSDNIKGIADQLLSCNTRAELIRWCTKYYKPIETDTSLGSGLQGSKKIAFLTYLKNIDKYSDRLVEKSSDKKFDDYNLSDLIGGGSNKSGLANAYYSSVSYYKDPTDRVKLYTSYATKHAEIFTSFQVGPDRVTNLQFLDTPGIGEQKPGLGLILTESISMKLDIILVIRAVEEKQTNKNALEELINALKSKFDGKSTSKDIIYFILNMWDGVEYHRGEEERDSIKALFGLNQANAGAISIDNNHFRMINVRDGIEFIKGGNTNTNNPLGKYLYSIFKTLIPNIESIDNEFCHNAEREYKEIDKIYSSLKNLILSLGSKLPNYSDYGRIKSVIESFHKALFLRSAKIPKIMATIKYPVDEFCKEPTGSSVSKLFGIDFSQSLDDQDSISSFVEDNIDTISLKYDEGSWNLSLDFQKYEEIKEELCRLIMSDLRGKIDQSEADKIIRDTKKEIAEIFIESGKMTMFGNYDENWWNTVASKLSHENNCHHIVALCKEFGNYSIDALKTLQEPIERVANNCKHSDNFGEDNDFVEFFNACVAIVYSLVQIEKKAKKSISEGSIKQSIENIEKGFTSAFLHIARLGAGKNPIKSTPIWDELYGFYERHSAEIFIDDDILQKRGLVKRWNSLRL